jgi:hypothetical protein
MNTNIKALLLSCFLRHDSKLLNHYGAKNILYLLRPRAEAGKAGKSKIVFGNLCLMRHNFSLYQDWQNGRLNSATVYKKKKSTSRKCFFLLIVWPFSVHGYKIV